MLQGGSAAHSWAMNILTQPETLTFLADHADRGWHPWPFFWIFPLLFWLGFITIAFLARNRFRRNTGIGVLRDGFARGEITEDQYRARLAVLRETQRGDSKR